MTEGPTAGDVTAGDSGGGLPRLAVLYDEMSVDVFRFAAAGEGTWRTVWLLDGEYVPQTPMRRLLARVGDVVDITGLEPDAVREAIGVPVGGLVVLNEARLMAGARLAPALGVDFYPSDVVTNLTDKRAQRAALRAAGLPTPAVALIPAGSGVEQAVRASAELSFPAVIKPAHGRSSRSTGEVRGIDDVVAFVDRESTPLAEDFVIEERIPDGWHAGDAPYGDYVSVESFLSAGRFAHFPLTGRTPLASGFRETGAVVPSSLPPDDWPIFYAVAEVAIRGLGAVSGVFHTEIKISPDGPRVIEVNGRLGAGSITWLAERVADVSLLEAVGKVALGLPVDFGDVRLDGVGLFYLAQAPDDARLVRAVAGIEEVRGLPGVDEVVLAKPPGSALDPRREGTLGFVYSVRARARDHDALWGLLDAIRSTVLVDYDS